MNGAVLAIDVSAAVGGLALLAGDRVFSRELPHQRRHGEALIPEVGSLMTEANLDWGALAGIGVAVGPGSFTGIRVGLAAAQGLALAHALPVAGIGSLEVVAEAWRGETHPPSETRVIAVRDVRRGQLAVQAFRVEGETLTATGTLELVDAEGEALAARLPRDAWVAGDPGPAPLPPGVRGPWLPAGSDLGTALARLARRALKTNPPPPKPLYARGANAKIPKGRGGYRE